MIKITASQVVALMGESRFKTTAQQKKEIADIYMGTHVWTDNYPCQYGRKNEVNAVGSFASNYKLDVSHALENQQTVYHPDLEWLGATPDGIIRAENALLEVKCPLSDKPVLTDDEFNRYLQLYSYQLKTQLFVTNSDYVYFFVWRKCGCKCVKYTERLRQDDIDKLFKIKQDIEFEIFKV